MSFFSWVANGIGTLIGVVKETVAVVVETVRTAYRRYTAKGGSAKEEVVKEAEKKKDRLREVNDEIMSLRNRAMSRGGMSDQDRRRWNDLREEREELISRLNQVKEVKAAEKILDSEATLEKVEIDLETSHVLQYNAFADALGKTCQCGRPMKLQWRRELNEAGPKDFYWGCTGWYIQTPKGRACSRTEPLQRADYGLMTDTSAPEFSLTAADFGIFIEDPGTSKIITDRVNTLRLDLSSKRQGVELVTCPVHGEHMVLRRKSNPQGGLLDTFFLACPHWRPGGDGCSFIEKLKSGPQLAALLKSQTGSGIL